MYGNARQPALHQLALAGVQPAADLQAEGRDCLRDRLRAADGSGRAVKGSEQAIPAVSTT